MCVGGVGSCPAVALGQRAAIKEPSVTTEWEREASPFGAEVGQNHLQRESARDREWGAGVALWSLAVAQKWKRRPRRGWLPCRHASAE